MTSRLRYTAILAAILPLACLFAAGGAVAGLDWPMLKKVAQQIEIRGLNGHPAAAEEAVIEALIKKVDPQSALLTDAEMQQFNQRRNGYVSTAGILLASADEHVAVTGILNPGITNLAAGARLLSIDGEPTEGTDIFSIYSSLRGEQGESVELVVSSGSDSSTATVSVERVSVQMPPLAGMDVLPRNIAYVKLRGFYGEVQPAEEALASALKRPGSLGTVLDLRGAGGLSPAAAASVFALFNSNPDARFLYQPLAGGEAGTYPCGDAGAKERAVVVLVDGETRGAAEVFAALCSEKEAGIIVLGEETQGDLLLRDFTQLAADKNLYLPAYELETCAGNEYNGRSGVAPDIEVPADSYGSWSASEGYSLHDEREMAEGEKENLELRQRIGRDAPLARAIDILLGLKALDLD